MVALQRAVLATHQLLVGDSHCPQIAGLLQGAKPPLLAMSAAQHPLQWISRGLQQQREVGQPIRTLHLMCIPLRPPQAPLPHIQLPRRISSILFAK